MEVNTSRKPACKIADFFNNRHLSTKMKKSLLNRNEFEQNIPGHLLV